VPTRAEAEASRADALSDINEEGAPCVLQWIGGEVDEASGVIPPGSTTDVPLHAVITGYSAREVNGSSVQQGDVRVLVADMALDGQLPADALAAEPGPANFYLYVGNPPGEGRGAAFPDPADAATYSRRYKVVALEDTYREGAWRIAHVLRARA
jgi:hypothetical protein